MKKLLFTILAVLHCAPAHVARPSLVQVRQPRTPWPPAVNTWIELHSARFSLRTDLGAATAAKLMASLENDVITLADIPVLTELAQPMRATVIAFTREADARTVCGEAGESDVAWNDSAYTICFVGDTVPLGVMAEAQARHTLAQAPYWVRQAAPAYLSRATKGADGWRIERVRNSAMTLPLLDALTHVQNGFELQTMKRIALFTAMSEGLLQTFIDGASGLDLHSPNGVSLIDEALAQAYRDSAVAPAPLIIVSHPRDTAPVRMSALSTDDLSLMRNELERGSTVGRISTPPPRISGQRDPTIAQDKLQGLRGRHGLVLIKVRVTPAGIVSGAQVLRSTLPEVESDVIAAVLKWRFAPPGEFVEYLQPFTFVFN